MKKIVHLPILVLLAGIAVLLAANLGIIFGWVLPALQTTTAPAVPTIPLPTNPSPVNTIRAPQATLQPTNPTATLPPKDALEGLRQQGVMVFSMADGLYYHLFVFHPQFLPLTRLTAGPWDDINPAVSPDGSRIAFSSHQNGYWNLVLLDLASGRQTRLTDNPQYDGAPTWSPDGQFLAYQSLTGEGMQIFILNLAELAQPPMQLTFAPGQSFSPAWSPQGREIAFSSTQSNQEDIWLARLDRIDDRFINLSINGSGHDRSPRWSPRGETLAWSSVVSGANNLMVWNAQSPEQPARLVASGAAPVWSPQDVQLLAEIREANQTSLAVVSSQNGSLAYPPMRLPGQLAGSDWQAGAFADQIAAFPVPPNSREPAEPLFQPEMTLSANLQNGRQALAPLDDLNAPYPYLADSADDSFQALRRQVARLTGWDFLASLENAYLPVSFPALPELKDNWLYTGRAFAINATPISAGWVTLLREDLNGQTFWRIYVRCLVQDASAGRPLEQRAWDLDARYRGDPRIYDQGGELSPIPAGYWIDFTELAGRYGWQRLPALINWRTYYPATQFGTFVLRGDLSWRAAMDQIYPAEAIATPTLWASLTPSTTPTPTLYYQRLITPSITPTPTLTATLNPTSTPPGNRSP